MSLTQTEPQLGFLVGLTVTIAAFVIAGRQG